MIHIFQLVLFNILFIFTLIPFTTYSLLESLTLNHVILAFLYFVQLLNFKIVYQSVFSKIYSELQHYQNVLHAFAFILLFVLNILLKYKLQSIFLLFGYGQILFHNFNHEKEDLRFLSIPYVLFLIYNGVMITHISFNYQFELDTLQKISFLLYCNYSFLFNILQTIQHFFHFTKPPQQISDNNIQQEFNEIEIKIKSSSRQFYPITPQFESRELQKIDEFSHFVGGLIKSEKQFDENIVQFQNVDMYLVMNNQQKIIYTNKQLEKYFKTHNYTIDLMNNFFESIFLSQQIREYFTNASQFTNYQKSKSFGNQLTIKNNTSQWLSEQHVTERLIIDPILYPTPHSYQKLESHTPSIGKSKIMFRDLLLSFFKFTVDNNAKENLLTIVSMSQFKAIPLDQFTLQVFLSYDQKSESYNYVFRFLDLQQKDESIKQKYAYFVGKQMFQSLSHEFGTSLNSILSITTCQLLKIEDIPESLQFEIRCINVQALIMQLIVQDLRDYNSLINKKLQLTLSKLRITEIINQIHLIFNPLIELKQLKFVIQSCDGIIFSDFQRIMQMLSNLITNSIKFTQKGLIQLTISSEMQGNMHFYKFSIKDTGMGMSMDEISTLREFLAKGYYKNYQKKSKTYGIGLQISNQLAQHLSGQEKSGIQFTSENNVGSEFFFFVKNQKEFYPGKSLISSLKENDDQSGISVIGEEETKKPNAFNDFRITNQNILFQRNTDQYLEILTVAEYLDRYHEISQIFFKEFPFEFFYKKKGCLKCSMFLIVDDEQMNCLSLQMLLKSLNLSCEYCFNGYICLDKCQQRKQSECCKFYQVILMDINMPGLDGYATTRQLRDKFQESLIIGCSAFDDSKTWKNCYDSGMDGYISKPVRRNWLKVLIEFLFI